jgi:hypothetical protein
MLSSIETLNARIARKALGLGVSLKNDGDVANLMSLHRAATVAATHRRTPGPCMENQRRESQGLLVLRYSIEMGVRWAGALAILPVTAEQYLVRHGFSPGDDGIALSLLFNSP